MFYWRSGRRLFAGRLVHLMQSVGDFDQLQIDILQQRLQLRLRVENLDVECVRIVAHTERSRNGLGVISVNIEKSSR